MSDIAQLVAKQIEAQVTGLVRKRLGTIIGELDTMLEERAHAHEMIVEMDHKIAARLETLRYNVANIMTPEAAAAVPARPADPPPEPVPAPRPTPCPPLPPAAEPATPEPAEATGPAPLKATKLRDAVVEIAEASDGLLVVGEARKQLEAAGLLKGTMKQRSKALGNVLYQSPRFERGPRYGTWRLRDAPPPPPREPRKKTGAPNNHLLTAVIDSVKRTGRGEFNSLDIRNKLMSSAALTDDPVKASQALSYFLHNSDKFENIGRGKWRLVEQPTGHSMRDGEGVAEQVDAPGSKSGSLGSGGSSPPALTSR